MSEELRSIQNASKGNVDTTNKISILFKDKDPTKGLTLQQDALQQVEIVESMFSLLPTISITIKDKGRFFYTYHLKAGDSIYITISSNNDEEDKDITPIIDSKFVIQSIQYIPNPDSEVTDILISGIYNAEPYLNEIINYPSSNNIANLDYRKKTSFETVKEVMSDIGMLCETEDPEAFSDQSYWLCCNETRAQFIDRIISHSWVGMRNAPILYTDKYGISRLVTTNQLGAKETNATIRDLKVALSKNQTAADTLLLCTGMTLVNASGPILNQGGYVVKETSYDPYNVKLFDNLKDAGEYIVDGIINGFNAKFNPYDSVHTIDYKQNESVMGAFTSKDTAMMDTCSVNDYTGMKFSELHSFYEDAPKHNEMVRRSFFQNFVKLAFDTSRQSDAFKKGKKRPELGDKYFVDFSSVDIIDKLQSGPYIINQIKHAFIPGYSYTMALILSSDGYYGERR